MTSNKGHPRPWRLPVLPSNARAASTRWDQSKPVAVSGRGIRPGSACLDLSDMDPSENQNTSKQKQNHSVSHITAQSAGRPHLEAQGKSYQQTPAISEKGNIILQ